VFRRRLLLVAGVAAALYPMLQFINFRLPRKPRVVQINQNVGTDGSLTTDELIVFTDDAGSLGRFKNLHPSGLSDRR
jgi:hypothetical protein